MNKLIIILSLFFIFSIYSSVYAENKHCENFKSLFENWNLTLGGGLLIQPEYQGSDKMRIIFLPIAAPIYRKFLYFTPMGIGTYFPIYKFKILGKVGLGYDLFKISGERKINGLDDVEKGMILDTGLIFNINKYFNANINARKVFWGSDSLHIDAKITTKYEFEEKVTLSLSVMGTFGDKKYMKFKFGITPNQSIISGFPVYDPAPTFKSIAVEIAVKVKIIKGLSLTFSHSEGFLLNDATKSPTTFRIRQPRTLMMINYFF